MADTWGTRKRAEAEAMEWADEPIGGGRKPRVKDPAPQPTDRLERDREIGHVEKQTENNPYRYLGHFAGDDVTTEGHNTGAKPPGTAHGVSTEVAKRGYRTIPGSASKLVGSASYHGRHYGDEVDRAASESAAVGLNEPKFVRTRREKREKELMAGLPTTSMPFPAMAVKAPRRGKRSR